MWILLGYPSNILGYILGYQVNTVITLPRGNYDGSPIPPPVNNFFNIHLTKNNIVHNRGRI